MSEIKIAIAKMEKGKVFDKKYETTLPPIMKAAMEKAFRSSEIKKALADGSKSFTVDATINSLTQTPKGTVTRLDMNVTMVVSDSDSAFGFLKGNGNIPEADTKRLDGDVKALVEAVLAKMITKDVSKAVEARIAKT